MEQFKNRVYKITDDIDRVLVAMFKDMKGFNKNKK